MSIDPIRWQGFPAVDQQEVFVRLIFDEESTGGGSCAGEASPGGHMCRTTLGLVRRDELPDMNEWRIVRSGTGGEWGFYADRGHVDGSGAETAGQNAIGFKHTGLHQAKALMLWDGAGVAPIGYWFQVAHKIADLTHGWYDSQWNGIAVASESDSEQYVCEMLHACGLFKTWDYQAIYARVGGGLLTYKRGQRTTEAYQYLKAARTDAGLVQMYSAFSSQRAHGSAGTLSVADTRWGAGQVGLAVNACGNQAGRGLSLFSHPTLCRGNTVTVSGLPVGWRLEIDITGATLVRLGVVGDGTTKQIDFGGNAWPYTTYFLYDDDGNLIESWTPTTNPGVWGGDVITIGGGAGGVPRIGGPAARLQPSTDPGPAPGPGGDLRITEAGDLRTTEAGDSRLLE